MILFATRLRRRFDVQWQFGGGDRQSTGIANLMPLASELAVRGYLERMEAALKDRFGGDFEKLRVRPYVISLEQHEPLAVLGRIVTGESGMITAIVGLLAVVLEVLAVFWLMPLHEGSPGTCWAFCSCTASRACVLPHS